MSNTDKSGSRGSIGRLNVGAASPHTGSSSNIGAHRGSATHLSATGATTSRSNLLGGSTGHLNTSQTQLTTSQTNLKQQQGSSRGSRGSLNAIGGGRGSVVATTSTSRIAPAHDAATADLLFKMSKKIAQLTKVVYVLNTQNEDVEREVRMARREHEREVAELIEENAKKLDTYKELLEQDHEERQKQVASAVEKAEATFQETVAKLTKDVADAKRESAERELVFKQQVVDMDKDVTEIRNIYETRLAEFHSRVASIKDEYQTHVQTIQSELKTTVRTSQEQLAEQKSVHENAVGGLEQLLNESTQQQVELREQINAVTLRHSKELQDARERIIQLHTDLEESRQRADAESAERQSLIDQLTAANAELTVKQGTSVAELEEKTAALEKLRHDLEEMESIVAETTQRVLAAESGNMKSLDVLAEKEAVVEELEAKTAELQSEVDEVQAQASKAREQLQKREEDHRLVKNLLAASERKAAEYMEECRRLKKETEQSFDEKAKHERQVYSLTLQLEESKKDVAKRLKEEAARFRGELEKEKSKAAATAEERAQKAQIEFKKLSEDAARTSKLAEVLNQTVSQLTEKNDKLHKEVAHGKQVQSNQENQIADLQNEIRIQEQDKQELYQQLFDAKKRTTKELTEVHREHLQRLEVEFEERLVTEKALLTAEKQTALDDLRKQFANQIVETTKEEVARVGREYAQQRQAQERQIAYFKTQLATSEQKNQSLVHDLEDKDRVTTSLLTQQKTAHAEELVRLEATLRGKFEETLQENIDRHLADYKKAFAELEQKFNNTVREHAAEIENLQDGFEAAKENTLKEKNDERESMVARLAQLHQSNLDEAREQFKKALADHDARTAREKDEAIREIENRCNKIVQERDAEVVEAKKALSRRETETRQVQELVNRLKEEVRGYEKALQIRDEELGHVREIMRAGLVKLDTELAVKHQRHLDLRQQEHIKEQQRMMQDFDRARAIFQKELAEKERQLDDANERYENREARDEDQERIQDLEEELMRKKRKMKAMSVGKRRVDELAHLKLELLNREDNLNRIFNNRPQVGLISALAPAMGAGGKRAPAGGAGLTRKLPPVNAQQQQQQRRTSSQPSLAKFE